MKKILNILGTITLIGVISKVNLIACNNKIKTYEYTGEELKKLKENNKINITNQQIKDNLEGIISQEKPFNKIDNKYYFVVGHGLFNDELKINVFNNNADQIKIDTTTDGLMKNFNDLQVGYGKSGKDGTNYPNYFKVVYRGNLDISKPDLFIDHYGNIKISE